MKPFTHEFCISGSCVPSFCGDGLVDFFNGEECDGTPDCDESCFVRQAECDDSITCPNDDNPCNGETICVGGGCMPTDWAPDCSPCLGGDGIEGRCIAGDCHLGPISPDDPLACYDPRIRGGAGVCCGFECRLLEYCLREGGP